MKKFFSCLFVKFVLYTSRFLGEGTGFLFVIYGIIAAVGILKMPSGHFCGKITAGGHHFTHPPAAVSSGGKPYFTMISMSG